MSNELFDYLKAHVSYSRSNNKLSLETLDDYRKWNRQKSASTCPIDTESKFYYMASLVASKPNLVNPKIYSATVAHVAFNDEYYDADMSSEDADELKVSVKGYFNRTLEEGNIYYLQRSGIREVYIVREVLLRSRESYHVIERWQKLTIILLEYSCLVKFQCYGQTIALDKILQKHPYSILSFPDFDKPWVEIIPLHRLLANGRCDNCPDDFKTLSFEMKARRLENGTYKFITTFHMYEPNDNDYVQNFLDKMKKKLDRWGQEETLIASIGSLRLISNDQYLLYYDYLKELLFADLKLLWIKVGEKTDAEKFIAEDFGIAAYLKALNILPSANTVNGNAVGKRTFVDLGCGNGLLTFLLEQMGWVGIGIDLRSRRLWPHFEELNGRFESSHFKTEHIIEAVINPFVDQFSEFNSSTVFIGNHADELTPWVPYIARKYKASFVVIPCCAYKFDGTKLEKEANRSSYDSYISYIQDIAVTFGFKVHVDKLRIPSTRRTALIGVYDNRPEENLENTIYWNDIAKWDALTFAEAFLNKRQKVSNCTQIAKESMDLIISKIFNLILNRARPNDMIYNEGFTRKWNRGCQEVPFSVLTQLLTDEEKLLLKNQSKGFQTLIRNHKYIFTLTNNRKIQLRVPSIYDAENLKDKSKLRVAPCYFHHHHPNGCPIKDKDCAFDHDPLWFTKYLFESSA